MAGGKKTCTYVFIPWDISKPLEERTLSYSPDTEVEALLNELRGYFRRASGTKTEAQRKRQEAQLLEAAKGAAVSEELLKVATGMSMVESLSLLPHVAATGHVGVNMYVDDEGAIKELPGNPRASDIATRCRASAIHVRGDAFVARIVDDGRDLFERRDMRIADLSSDAPWFKQAAELAHRAAAREMPHELLGQMEGGAGAGPAQGARAAAVGGPGPLPGPLEPLPPPSSDFGAGLFRTRPARAKPARELSAPPARAAGGGGEAGAPPPPASTPSDPPTAEQARALAEKELGNEAFRRGDNVAAEAAYSRALEADPCLLVARNNRAQARLALGDEEGAERDASTVLEALPGDSKALLRRAAARKALGRGIEAKRDLEAILAASPGHTQAKALLRELDNEPVYMMIGPQGA